MTMADGAYRWFGNAPAPDAARVADIHATYDEQTVHAFGEPARVLVEGGLERALAAARVGDLSGVVAALADARARVEALRPQALEPRRGLAGLFDGRGKRLKRFREAFHDAAARLAASAAVLGEPIEGATRRSGALEAIWGELRDGVADLDAHIASAARRLTGHTPSEDGASHPLQARKETLDACRAAALQSLPLIRSAQNVDARASEALKQCTDGLASWRDDWREALGLSGKRPRRIRPDGERLARSRDQFLARLDRTLADLTSFGVRRSEVETRLAALRTTPGS